MCNRQRAKSLQRSAGLFKKREIAATRSVQVSDLDQGVTLCATSDGVAESVIERLVQILNQHDQRHVIFPTEKQMLSWLKAVEKLSHCQILNKAQIKQMTLSSMLIAREAEDCAV